MTARQVYIPEAPDLPYRLGRSVEHDERSKAFRAVTAPIPLRDKYHRRWGPLLDQGNVGACTYFGLLNSVHRKPLYKRGHKYTNADGVSGYSRATEIDPFPGTYKPDDTGSSGLAACKVAKERGVITSYDHAFGLDQTLQALMTSPVMVGTVWTENMFHVPASGIIEYKGAEVGGHLYVLSGLDVDNRLVRIECAWRRWGVKHQQWAWLGWTDLGNLLDNWGECMVPRRSV